MNADKLGRYLRNLCNLHIFREVRPGVFVNNSLSAVFCDEKKRALVGHWYVSLPIIRKEGG